MGSGLFVNDLFNGEALSGGYEADRGLFRRNLFDSQPLGQTTPTSTTPEITPASDSLISQLATTGGAKVSGGSAIAAPSKDGSGGAYSPYATPTSTAMMPADYGASAGGSDVPWVPIALIGGAVVLTVGFVMMSRKPAASTANRRARRNKRKARRNRRHR